MKGKGLKRNETPGMQSRGRFPLQPPYVGECEARALGMRIVELPAGSPSGFPVRYSWTSL